ncbi:MAG TPA: hypothetical protein DEF06_03840, partial [Clostridiales bacterium]|nr:hypothetical protein [Clostridiales bacterium]
SGVWEEGRVKDKQEEKGPWKEGLDQCGHGTSRSRGFIFAYGEKWAGEAVWPSSERAFLLADL